MSAGAGVVDESATARETAGLAPSGELRGPRAAPVEPAAAAAGDCTEFASRVVVDWLGP
jgi:hypothetical protein